MPSLQIPYSSKEVVWEWSWVELDKLQRHAQQGHRIWELFQVLRPIDLVRYLYADIQSGAQYLDLPIDNLGKFMDRRHLSIDEFRGFLPSAEAQCELERALVKDGFEKSIFARFEGLVKVQELMNTSDDPLIQYELSCIKGGWSKYDRAVWQTGNTIPLISCHNMSPVKAIRSQAFLEISKGLIQLKAIESVAVLLYFDDFELISLLSREWLRRKQRGETLEGYSMGVSSWGRRDVDTYDNWESGIRYDIPIQPEWTKWFIMSDEGIGEGDLELNLQEGYEANAVYRRSPKVILSDMPWGGGPLPESIIWHYKTDSMFAAVTTRGEDCVNQVKAIVEFVLEG